MKVKKAVSGGGPAPPRPAAHPFQASRADSGAVAAGCQGGTIKQGAGVSRPQGPRYTELARSTGWERGSVKRQAKTGVKSI